MASESYSDGSSSTPDINSNVELHKNNLSLPSKTYTQAENKPENQLITADHVHNSVQLRRSRSLSTNSAESSISQSSTSKQCNEAFDKNEFSLPLDIKFDSCSMDSNEEDVVRRRSASMMEVKEHAHSRLREELSFAQQALMLKAEQCSKLTHVQEQMERELEELTASLFTEANKMVQDANLKRLQSEKLLKEANTKIDVLSAEVAALKALVITSTPSTPNKHLHPQINVKESSSFIKGHRRSTSHHNFRGEIIKKEIDFTSSSNTLSIPDKTLELKNCYQIEIDDVYLDELKTWRQNPTLDKISQFISRINNEEITPCLSFNCTQLSKQVQECVSSNTLMIEPIQNESSFPKHCSLTGSQGVCPYKIRIGDKDEWHAISQLARNRIIAVCDFYQYVRYISLGLVKAEDSTVYCEIIRLRNEINQSRLGLI